MTEKQKRFADYYIETGNAEEAAKRAGYNARGNTTKLLQNTTIREYIDSKIAEKDAERIAKQDEILERLTRVLRREEKETVVVTVRRSRTYYDDNGKKVTVDEEVPEVVEIPTKISDMNRAAELLGKRYAMWTENHNLNGDMTIKVALPQAPGDDGDDD